MSTRKEMEMDADFRKIPIVEDDQGEGFKDPWEECMEQEFADFEDELREKLHRKKFKADDVLPKTSCEIMKGFRNYARQRRK